MNTTTELLQQLNTMQTEHIKVLNERIEVLQQTIQIDKITIKTQEKTIKLYLEDYDNRYINFDVINTFNE
mgnify:FL=1|tara:strand:- start:129 stop:338 length:210 start_codon:yes stop_codon:yes gene_type:complete